MNKRILGRTGLRVSELCLGTLNFGWATNREDSWRILDHYRGAGGNFVQTAGVTFDTSITPDWASFSESYVGDWMCDRGVPRNEIVLSSALSFPSGQVGGASASERIALGCDAAIRRLRTDHIDLLVCRWHPSFAESEEVVSALTALVQKGRIRYFGFAGFPLWRVMETLSLADRKVLCRLEALQATHSLLENGRTQAQLREFCARHRASLLVQSPLAGGFLAHRYDPAVLPDDERSRRLQAVYGARDGLGVFSRVESVADPRGVAPSTVALAWVLAQPSVTAAIIGAKSTAHLRDAFRASEITLSVEERALLERLPRRGAIPSTPIVAPAQVTGRIRHWPSRSSTLPAT